MNALVRRLGKSPHLRRLSVEIDNISIERLVRRLAKVRIGFGVSYLDCFTIKQLKDYDMNQTKSILFSLVN